MIDDELRKLPSVHKLLNEHEIKQLTNSYPQSLIVNIIRKYLDEIRDEIKGGEKAPLLDVAVQTVKSRLISFNESSLVPVINATGVILHTNIGRAPLSKAALEAMKIASEGYCNLEFELDNGLRGSRYVHIEKLLCYLSGAEGGLVVNNNAGAVLLILTALAKRKEVIVSRGEAVEIGGGFRIPDVMRQSGAKLIEVGTTNCTYIKDYEQAINEKTVALLRVHPSNFRIHGFTNRVELAELVTLAVKYGIFVIEDLGSGCFLDTTKYGLEAEHTVQQSIQSGVGVVSFSGDKLVGGPQAGIIVGKRQYIDKLKRHPLTRALRIDKSRLAGLISTIMHYIKEEAEVKIPVWQMISMPINLIEERANKWAKILGGIATVVDGESMIGGGSLPGNTLPTKLVAIKGKIGRSEQNLANVLGKKLREQKKPIIGRIEKDVLYLDPRTVPPESDDEVIKILKEIVDIKC